MANTKSNTITFWMPRDGYMLHNRFSDTWSDCVLLGPLDNATDWWEEPMSVYEEWLAQQGNHPQVEEPQEPMQEELLSAAKSEKIAAIADKDASVKKCSINGKEMWMDAAERHELMHYMQSRKAKNKLTAEWWIFGAKVSTTCAAVISLLQDLAIYDYECQCVSNQHRANVEAMTTIEDVEAYDINDGYPSQPTFVVGGTR